MKKRRLITSALPYVNNIPHLGNLIQVLSADVFARYCRAADYETLYICGTDEYGTATETKALQEGITPQELCDRYYTVHDEIYKWFNIDFDKFGRTSTDKQKDIVQHLFKKIDENGYIKEDTIEQLYCRSCERFLADRFVLGTCPHCDYEDARGDQCEHCGKLLEPTELSNPRCSVCNETPELRKTKHLYIRLPEILPKLEAWMEKASVEGNWARNAIQMTKSWIRDGLKERAITRDLKWGIPVPKEGFEDKVFYVWFDAPIGYISITANHTDDWKSWWMNPDNVELYQFIGKDNIPFHTVIFPSTLLGSNENWTMLHCMSSSEYLNYESGKFSKSKGVGVFGNDAFDTGIPADVWRFYIFYNRPEKSDYMFTWKDFQEKVNSELIGNYANLVNRTLSFVNRFYNGELPQAQPMEGLWKSAAVHFQNIEKAFENANLRDALRESLLLSSLGNKIFQDAEPWRTRTEAPQEAEQVLCNLTYLVRDLSVLMAPFIPETSRKVLSWLGETSVSFEKLGKLSGIRKVEQASILFKKLEDKEIDAFRERFAGTQDERKMKDEQNNSTKAKQEIQKTTEELFFENIDLRVAKITAIERHPEADKLYVETMDAGEEEERTVVSGLVPHYEEAELLNKHIILVANLKPAKLRGVKSMGMLLAAEEGETVDVLFADHADPGTRLYLDGDEDKELPECSRLKVDKFFEIPIKVRDGVVYVGEKALMCNGQRITAQIVKNGDVG